MSANGGMDVTSSTSSTPKVLKSTPEKLAYARAYYLKKKAARQKIVAVVHEESLPIPPPEPAGMVTVRLFVKHTINGTPYGPGTLTVERGLAQTLMAGESGAVRAEMKAVQPRAYLVKWGPNGPVRIEVPYSQFNKYVERELT